MMIRLATLRCLQSCYLRMQDYIVCIIISMNMRRLKKKKGTLVNKNQQELAQDKLFEISYLCEEKYIDQSQILAIDHRHYRDQSTQGLRRSHQLQEIIQKKNKDNNPTLRKQKEEISEKKVESLTCERRTVENQQKGIFNTLESTQVFVGCLFKGKRDVEKEKRALIFFDTKRRVQTLPAMPKIEPLPNKSYLKTQKSQQKGEFSPYTTQYKRLCRASHSLNKSKAFSNYHKLKQKLRLDLFMKTLNCTFKRQQ